jgi:hypothetical protein
MKLLSLMEYLISLENTQEKEMGVSRCYTDKSRLPLWLPWESGVESETGWESASLICEENWVEIVDEIERCHFREKFMGRELI